MSRRAQAERLERVQKVLARGRALSRRAADELVAQGRVEVNGVVATPGTKIDPARDSLRVDGRPFRARVASTYLLLNKPRGYVTTLDDPEGRETVLDLVPRRHQSGIFPVGRLDYHTEGLLILTDDGELAEKVSHPRHGCRKLYEVKVRGVPDAEKLRRLKRGLVIDGRRASFESIEEHRPQGRSRPSQSNSWWLVTLAQGRNRQIRELFFRMGHPVQRLRRIAIGPLRDSRLRTGEVRELTDDEVESLRRGRSATKATRAPGRRRPVAAGKGRAQGAGGASKTAKKGKVASRPSKAQRKTKVRGKPARRPKGRPSRGPGGPKARRR